MPIYALGDDVPHVHPEAYVHPEATLIGRVHIGPETTVWPGAVLRADFGEIHVGTRTSIQDGTVVHTTEEWPTVIAPETMALGVPARMRPLDPVEQAGWIDVAVQEYVDNGRRFSTELRLIPQESSITQGARP